MVLSSRFTSARAPRRVALQRGKKAGDNAYSKKIIAQPKTPRKPVNIPWSGIGHGVSLAGLAMGGFILVAAVSLGLLLGYRFVTSSAYFSLKTIEIQGNSRLSSKEILETIGLDKQSNNLAISIDEVEKALTGSPWVGEASVERVLPDRLVVRLKEKEPRFWVVDNGVLYYVDEFGRVIAPVVAGRFAALPVLEVEAGAESARAGLPDLVRSFASAQLPPDMGAISRVRLSAAMGVEVFVENSALSFSIGLEQWLDNLERLSRTMADLVRRDELRGVRRIRAEGSNVWVVKAG